MYYILKLINSQHEYWSYPELGHWLSLWCQGFQGPQNCAIILLQGSRLVRAIQVLGDAEKKPTINILRKPIVIIFVSKKRNQILQYLTNKKIFGKVKNVKKNKTKKNVKFELMMYRFIVNSVIWQYCEWNYLLMYYYYTSFW